MAIPVNDSSALSDEVISDPAPRFAISPIPCPLHGGGQHMDGIWTAQAMERRLFTAWTAAVLFNLKRRESERDASQSWRSSSPHYA